MREWKEYRIGDVVVTSDFVANGSFASLKENVTYLQEENYAILIRLSDYHNKWNGPFVYVDKSSFNFLKKSVVEHGDLIIANVGANAGEVFLAPRLDKKMTLGPNSILVKGAHTKYLYYYFSSNYGKWQLDSIITGSAQPKFNKTDLRNLKVKIPSESVENKICEILSSLDDKIELNNKINQELENLAQTLFKRWFIDFEFPNENGEPYKSSGGEMVESELGEIPKGWEVKTTGDVAQVIDCLHSKKPVILNVSTGYLFLQLSNIKDNGLLDLTQKFWISKEDYQKWTSRIEVKEGDFVITNVGRSGAVSRIGKGVKAAIGRNMTAIRLKDNFQFNGFFSVLILSDFMKKEINSKLDSGTILDALNVKNIPKLRFAFPIKLELPLEFEKIVRPIWDKMEMNLIENNSLTDTRDYLLPKLITGELEINEISYQWQL
jgi:type I restriction enzyme S subunit